MLALPARLYSSPLQRAVVHEVADGALRSAREALARTTGQHLGTRQLQEIATEAARDVRDFYASACRERRPTPAASRRQGRDLLVLSIDATGVNMIPSGLRDPGPAPPGRPAAALGPAVQHGNAPDAPAWPASPPCYDAAPAPRTAADILPARRGRTRRAAERTRARRNRHMDASLEHFTAPMVTALFDQAERRDPEHLRRWIVLVDGANHQLDCI